MVSKFSPKGEILEAMICEMFADYCRRKNQPAEFLESFLQGVRERMLAEVRECMGGEKEMLLMSLLTNGKTDKLAELVQQEAAEELEKATDRLRERVGLLLSVD